jgi:hypothetical protein
LLQCTGTEISQEKYFRANFHGVQSDNDDGHTPRMRERGGIWVERNAKTKVKVRLKVKVKVKAKAKVDRSIHPPRIDPQINFLFLSGRRGLVGDERKKCCAERECLVTAYCIFFAGGSLGKAG